MGAGFAGLYVVHALRQLGLDVRGIERADGVGGTWWWNRYPGARCDVESIEYSYSFDAGLQQEWVWTERYASQPEILAYLEHVAERFGLLDAFRFGQTVIDARWHEGTERRIRDCIEHCERGGVATIEAEPDEVAAWVDYVNALAGPTLLPTCNSWYLGANVPGKPRVFMPVPGFPGYAAQCDHVAASGYAGFRLERPRNATIAS